MTIDNPDNKDTPPRPAPQKNLLAEMCERLRADLAAQGVTVTKKPYTDTGRLTATFIPQRKPKIKTDE